ncbi:histidine kinase dimerization/phospho-acceptor domain-containing protein, partial [Bacillus cereus]
MYRIHITQWQYHINNSSISHEVRNPLTVVKGFTQLLKTQNLTTESRDEYIKNILEELNRAQEIID